MGSAFYWISQGPDSVEYYLDNVTDLHGADAAGGSGADYIARIRGHALREISDQIGNEKNHGARVAILYMNAGDISPISMAICPLFPIADYVPLSATRDHSILVKIPETYLQFQEKSSGH